MQTTGEGTEQVTGGLVTPNTFRFLGVPAMLGRGLVPEDAKPDAPAVFVMSYKMWVSRTTRTRACSDVRSSSMACHDARRHHAAAVHQARS